MCEFAHGTTCIHAVDRADMAGSFDLCRFC